MWQPCHLVKYVYYLVNAPHHVATPYLIKEKRPFLPSFFYQEPILHNPYYFFISRFTACIREAVLLMVQQHRFSYSALGYKRSSRPVTSFSGIVLSSAQLSEAFFYRL